MRADGEAVWWRTCERRAESPLRSHRSGTSGSLHTFATKLLPSSHPPLPTALPAAVGVITISDRASLGVYEDKSGPAIVSVLTRWIASPWEPAYRLVPDEQPLIEAAIRELADELAQLVQ